jgi:trigger factor
MIITTKTLPKSSVELTIELSVEEMKPYLEKAAVRLSTEKVIEGFRPGKAPLDVVTKKFGEAVMLEASAEEAVRGTYGKAIVQEKIMSIGSPAIDVKKMTPGNPFIYTATVNLLPDVTLCDLATIKVEKKEIKIPETDIERAIKDLLNMRVAETVTTNAAGKTDKVVVNMDMKLDGVPLEGGQAKDHHVYMDEEHYIPGFTDQMLGMKKDEAKTFVLTFPKEHYQKNVAGKPVEFTVTVKDVYERKMPEFNDAFAAGFGQKTAADLDKLIRDNLLAEATHKEDQRQEIAAIEEIVKKSKFGDFPDILVNEEVNRMIIELQAGIKERGIEWEEYIAKAKKSETEMKLDFAPQAIDRIKAALTVRAIAAQNNIDVSDAEVAAEVEREMNLYTNDAKTQEEIRSEEYQDRVRFVLRNKKTVAFVKEKVVR